MARNPHTALESLLFRIRDRAASASELARARELVRDEARLPDELREVVDFTDDPVGDAVGLLAVLGADTLFGDVLRAGLAHEMSAPAPIEVTAEMVDADWAWSADLAAAVRAEAGEIELSDAVLVAVGGPERLPLASAVRAEAGEVELADAILAITHAHTRFPLAAAIAAEAGGVDVADAILAAVGGPERLPVAAAVRAEAGDVSLWAALEPLVSDVWVSAMLDHELAPAARRAAVRRLQEAPEMGAAMTAFASLGADLRAAVTREAGECASVWPGVAHAMGVEPEEVPGWDGLAFASAVRARAGSVDVVEGVMQNVKARARLPYAAIEVEQVPAPANQVRWSTGAVLMAMAAAFLLMALPGTWQVSSDPGTPVAMTLDAPQQFASADEIVVEALDYGDRANVTQATGDAGALILWVDEGATL